VNDFLSEKILELNEIPIKAIKQDISVGDIYALYNKTNKSGVQSQFYSNNILFFPYHRDNFITVIPNKANFTKWNDTAPTVKDIYKESYETYTYNEAAAAYINLVSN
jgi:hypothetical protein